MSELDSTQLHALVARLVESRVAASLDDVERALARWRAGAIGPLDAHGALLKHAARCERVVERVTAAAASRPAGVARDAFDVGLLDREAFVRLCGAEPEAVEPAGSVTEQSSTPDKRTVVEHLLEEGVILIQVDARKEGVVVPPRFRGDPKLSLKFGYGLTPAIVDLAVDEHGIGGTLSFGGQPFHCLVPWPAVYAVVIDGEQRGMVWPEDIPDVVLTPPSREAGAGAGAGAGASGDDAPVVAPAPAPVPGAGGSGAMAATPPAVSPEDRPTRPRGHLKLVD